MTLKETREIFLSTLEKNTHLHKQFLKESEDAYEICFWSNGDIISCMIMRRTAMSWEDDDAFVAQTYIMCNGEVKKLDWIED